MSDSANVISGVGTLYLAAKGTSVPALTSLPVDFSSFVTPGYTDDGVEFVYTPTFKDITVDEEMAPIDKLLTAEKLVINVKLAETTLNNLAKAIAGSSLSLNSPAGTSVLKFGSASSTNELVLGFSGPAPGGNATRVIIVYRVKSTAPVTFKYQREDKMIYNVQFEALADSSKSAGQRLCQAVDFNPAGS
jgi:hypothetical protein